MKGGCLRGRLSLEELLSSVGDEDGVKCYDEWKSQQLRKTEAVRKVNGNTANKRGWKARAERSCKSTGKGLFRNLGEVLDGINENETRVTYRIKPMKSFKPTKFFVKENDRLVKGFKEYRKANGLV